MPNPWLMRSMTSIFSILRRPWMTSPTRVGVNSHWRAMRLAVNPPYLPASLKTAWKSRRAHASRISGRASTSSGRCQSSRLIASPPRVTRASARDQQHAVPGSLSTVDSHCDLMRGPSAGAP
ncbi:hypothetical protein C3Y87_09480 [Carbonactinospora thermoautotrophica]|nr:hypothetical protein [Carbonactinospora thermoautotrophica]